MKRFLIHVNTNWCGMDDTFRAEAKSEMELDDIAEQLAYNNFQSYDIDSEIAMDNGCNPDEMSGEDWDNLWNSIDESSYYGYDIEEFTGDEDEWEGYGGEIYNT